MSCLTRLYYEARQIALNNGGDFHLIAVVKRGKTLLDLKTNLKRTHTKAVHPKPSGHVCRSQHAEHRALRQARQGDCLYVMRFKRCDGSLGNAKPCPECMEKIRSAGIRKVYYTNEHGNWEKLRF